MSDLLLNAPALTKAGRGRSDRIWLAVAWLLLIAAAVLVTMRLAGVNGSDAVPADASAEAGFARDMQTHHAQAVDLSMLAWQRSTDPRIRTLAYDIALTQQTQIGTMRQWLHEWGLSPSSTAVPMTWMADDPAMTMSVTADGLMPGMANSEETARLLTTQGRDFDVLYCQLMIRHHLGGIMMVDGLLDRSDAPQVTTLAAAMKAGQRSEVTSFDQILARDGSAG